MKQRRSHFVIANSGKEYDVLIVYHRRTNVATAHFPFGNPCHTQSPETVVIQPFRDFLVFVWKNTLTYLVGADRMLGVTPDAQNRDGSLVKNREIPPIKNRRNIHDL